LKSKLKFNIETTRLIKEKTQYAPGLSVYLLIGCDDFGFSVAETLRDQGVETVIVDGDRTRVEHLRNLGYREKEAVFGNPSSPDVLERAGLERAEVVLIMLPDYSEVEKVLQLINRLKGKLRIDPVVVVRVLEEAYAEDAKAMGASDVFPVNQLLTTSAVERFGELKLMVNEKRLRRFLEGERTRRGRLAIILQTNPDPDSIASGVAMKLYAKAFGVDADIIYDGVIGHPQNRALVNLLELEMLESRDVEFGVYRWFALVDVATHAHCALPPDCRPTIVVDHHAIPASEVEARIKDITPVAATSTILTSYLRFAGVEIDRPTATALLLGILTDTMNLIRRPTHLDTRAYEYLWGLADPDLLRRLISPTMPPEGLDVLMRAGRVSKIIGHHLFSNLGEVKDRDIIAYVSDFLLNREGITTTFVYGVVGKEIYVSVRTKDVSLHLGKALREAFSDIGSAGGHASMAGATIPISVFKTTKKNLKRKVDWVLRTRFLETVGGLRPRKRHKRSKK
jgi:nanoRNase/pAp phosphatase (c-di-AMP/oligoRNAs hydrolase)